MSDNSFFIPGLPNSAAPTPLQTPPPSGNPSKPMGDTLPHNEQGGRTTAVAAPHNEQGGRTAAREPDRYEPSVKPLVATIAAAESCDRRGAGPVSRTHPLHVHPLTTLCVAALLATLLVHATISTQPSAMTMAFAMFAGIVVGSLVIALVPFLFMRRSNRVLNLAMCVQMCLSIAGVGLMTWQSTASVEDQKIMSQAQASLSNLSGNMRRQLTHGEVAVVESADIDRAADALADAADKLDGNDAAVLRATAVLMSFFAERNHAFDALSDELESLGGLDPSTMKSRGDIQHRLTLIDQFLMLNRAFANELKAAPRQFRDSLVKEGLDHRELARAENEFAAGFKLPMQLQFRRLQVQFGESAKAYLGLLESQWGRWSFSTDTGQVVFENTSVIEEFNQASDTLQGSMLAMASIQREAMNVNLLSDAAPND